MQSFALYRRESRTRPLPSAMAFAVMSAASFPDMAYVEGQAVGILWHCRQAGRNKVARVHPTESGVNQRILSGFFLGRNRRIFEIERDSMNRKLDVQEFLGRRHHQYVAVFEVAARARRMKEILHGDTNSVVHFAYSLLQELGKLRIRRVDLDGVSKLRRAMKHGRVFLVGAKKSIPAPNRSKTIR